MLVCLIFSGDQAFFCYTHSVKEIESIVFQNLNSITLGENPEGKCDDWNDQLANIFLSLGWEATVVAESHVEVEDKRGRPIGHHAIAIARSPQHQWLAVDLSAAQISGNNQIFLSTAENLPILAEQVRSFFGGKWRALDNQEMLLKDIQRRRFVLADRQKIK
jgi:hypothetical protein